MVAVPASSLASPKPSPAATRIASSSPAIGLNGDQEPGAQNEASLSDAALLDEDVASLVGSSLHLWGELDALLLRKQRRGR
jgi:hypothetical protein